MRQLEINDKCYKFFPSCASATEGPRSIVYEAHKRYTGERMFFFRKDEAICSLKSLLYFMKFGDLLVEIRVDDELVNNALYVSPEHFVVNEFTTGNIYDGASKEMLELILAAVENCSDFDKVNFIDIVIRLIQFRGFDSALFLYEKICGERNLLLTELDERIIMELGSQPWCNKIRVNDVKGCQNMRKFINFMKSKISY